MTEARAWQMLCSLGEEGDETRHTFNGKY